MQRILFGSSGNPESFYASGRKSSLEMPQWLAGIGLNAYEYSLTRGVNIGEETAKAIGRKALEYDIAMSVHAPYYISLATEDEKTAVNTKRHFLRSLEAATWLNAEQIAFHPGGIGKMKRQEAMKLACQRLLEVLDEAAQLGLTNSRLAAETHGKANQLGDLSEILELCRLSPQVVPLVDFAHLYAVAGGGFSTTDDYERVFERIASALGDDAAKNLHIHFSAIEFSKGGEKRHVCFRDGPGPPFKPLIEVIVRHRLTPRIICESAGTQAEDAKTMQEFHAQLLK